MEAISTAVSPDRSKLTRVVMQPGPLHLFWTTGVFYLWSLRARFNLILIVPESYREDARFGRLVELPEIVHVEYLNLSTRRASHKHYSDRMCALLGQYQPSYVLMHNRSYPENQHLIHWARRICPGARRYNYQNGRASLNLAQDFAARRAVDIVELMERKRVFRSAARLAGWYVDARNRAAYFLNLKMLPVLSIGSAFSPPLNVYSGRVSREGAERHCNGKMDWQLAYLDIEIEKYREQGIRNIAKIEHPLRKNVNEVFSFLDQGVESEESKVILVVPSYGFTARLIECGWTVERTIASVAIGWQDAIKGLLRKFPGYSVKMKLHPASAKDAVWICILDQLKKEIPEIEIVPSSASAEWYAASAAVIVGDISSVLWWTALLGGKIVISLDIFNYPNGDELIQYEDHIYYVSNIDFLPDRPMNPMVDDGAVDVDIFFGIDDE